MKNSFYITTPIYYPNASLHMGHAYTTTLADILARYHKLKGEDTFFLSGTDDHSIQVAKAAEKENKKPKEFVLEKGQEFKDLYKKLGVEITDFIQTSDETRHWPGAILMWQKIAENGDFKKKKYKGLYCIGCEMFKKEDELVEGKCPLHNLEPQVIEEENWFFKLSKYQNILKEKIQNEELNIVPETRKNEVMAFIERGLDDVSFSRPKKSIPWGIPVPGDPDQTMYVWCDALVNYLSALGFGSNNDENYKKFWPADVHVIGKDILRFHAIIWPAMLISAKLPLPKSILVHGFINSGGRKMSKTLGNVIDPLQIINEYGTDALRYFLARELPIFDDGDFTMERFKETYNASLANGLGNLTSRIIRMQENYLPGFASRTVVLGKQSRNPHLEGFDIKKYADNVWSEISRLDKIIREKEPFKIFKTNPDEAKNIVSDLCLGLASVATSLKPLIPETAEKIISYLNGQSKLDKPLFPRKD